MSVLSRARQLFDGGDIEAAKALVRSNWARLRSDVLALNFLGALCFQSNEFDEAACCFELAIKLGSQDPLVYTNLGAAAVKLGRHEDGQRAFNRAICLDPIAINAVANTAAFLHSIKHHVEGQRYAKRRARIRPTEPAAWLMLSAQQEELGEYRFAGDSASRALILAPGDQATLFRIAELARRQEFLVTAIPLFHRVLVLKPADFEASLALTAALITSKNYLEASGILERLMVADPAATEVYINLALALINTERPDAALRIAERAISLNPASSGAHYNKGSALQALARPREALAALAQAHALGTDTPDFWFLIAHCHLMQGEFSAGWRYYEERWKSRINKGVISSSEYVRDRRPLFSGLSTGRVLVWAEQGVGDEVMFGGLLREFRGLCGEMLVQVDRRLVGLFERSLPGVKFFVRGEVVDESLYDEQIPIGSLARYLRPSRESFEGRGGAYLRAKAGLGEYFRERMGVSAGDRVIGLSWKSAAPATGAARSLGLEELVSALGAVGGGVRFVNLQYGDVGEELGRVKERLGVEVYSESEVDNREDLEGLAGLIEACDEVVSVGNATAHLAGALGKRTYVLLPYVAGWRWLHEGERCPWYDSVTLLRQEKQGNWSNVLRLVGNQPRG